MFELQQSDVRVWHRSGNASFPNSFALTCPHCSALGVFTCGSNQQVPSCNCITSLAKCPACSEAVTTVTITGANLTGVVGIYVSPAPSSRRPVGDGELSEVPAVNRAYQSAVDAFNVGLWDACATSCRKTLEGIVKTQGNSTGRTLYQQLNDFFQQQDLSQPLVHLTDTIREGGNLGAHFDLDKEPDQEIAAMMLDLIETFLEYIYVLPNHSRALESRLSTLSTDAEPESEQPDPDPDPESTDA